MPVGVSHLAGSANGSVDGIAPAFRTDGGNIEHVPITVKAYRGLGPEGTCLAGGLIVGVGLGGGSSSIGLVGPGGDRGSADHGIIGSIAVQIIGVQPQGKPGDGVFVKSGIGGHEGIDRSPGGTCAGHRLGGVVIGGAGGQPGQGVGDHSLAMSAGDCLGIVPVARGGTAIVVAPVESDGGIFTPLGDGGLIGVTGVVGMGGGKHGVHQSPLAGEITLDLQALALGNHPIEDSKFCDLTLIWRVATKVNSFGFAIIM